MDRPAAGAPINPFAEFDELLNHDPQVGRIEREAVEGLAYGRAVRRVELAPPARTARQEPAVAVMPVQALNATQASPQDPAADPPRPTRGNWLRRFIDVTTDESGEAEVVINLVIGKPRPDRPAR
jgi:hypothetical protein